jgi:glycosyltransferase involved in cell wall biosynthesis
MMQRNPAHNPPLVSIVVPALNEAKNLPYVLPRIPAWVSEILLVDGHSTDGTPEIAARLHPAVRIIAQKGRGKGDALRAGFAAAKGDIIVMMDADGSNDPDEIQTFLALLRAGADFVKGSRFIQGGGSSDMTFSRQIGNWGLMMLTRLGFGGHFTDFCYGYIAFWSRFLPILYPEVNGFEVEALLCVRALSAGLKVAEVPSFEAERRFGESHLRALPDGWRILKLILREWNNRQFHTPVYGPAFERPEPALSPSRVLSIDPSHTSWNNVDE